MEAEIELKFAQAIMDRLEKSIEAATKLRDTFLPESKKRYLFSSNGKKIKNSLEKTLDKLRNAHEAIEETKLKVIEAIGEEL